MLMPRWLVVALIGSGILAFLAIAFPVLIPLGLFLLIIPGIILAIAPTAFLWLAIFTGPYLLSRQAFREWQAIGIGLLMLTGACIAIPYYSILTAEYTLKRHPLPEVSASKPIALYGDVRTEADVLQRDGGLRFFCDGDCLALLFTPGVQSVTVDRPPEFTDEIARNGFITVSELAATYRLAPHGTCPMPAETPGDLRSHFGKDQAEELTLEAEWRHRLDTDVCLMPTETLKTYDFTMRDGYYAWNSGPNAARHWSIEPGLIAVRFQEIRGPNGKVIFRHVQPAMFVLSIPWSISPTGAYFDGGFEYSRQTIPKPSSDGQSFNVFSMLRGATPR